MVPRQHTAFRLDPAAFAQARLALPGLLAAHRAHGGQRVAVEFQDYGLQHSLFFDDPDGNVLELTMWPERGK